MEDEVANAKWNVYTLQRKRHQLLRQQPTTRQSITVFGRTLSGDFPLSPCITAVLFDSCLHSLVPKASLEDVSCSYACESSSEDFLFFGMIGLAWAVTLVTQPTFVYDNNITRRPTNSSIGWEGGHQLRPHSNRDSEECSNHTTFVLAWIPGQPGPLQLRPLRCACRWPVP